MPSVPLMVAVGLGCCLCLAASGTLRGKRANEGKEAATKRGKPLYHNLQYGESPTDFVMGSQAARRLPLSVLIPESVARLRNGVRSSDGLPLPWWLSLMPVAPIDANGLALVVSELTEGNEPTEGKEAATNQQS